MIAAQGAAPGQLRSPQVLALDSAGSLYVAQWDDSPAFVGQIQKRDAQGSWSVIAPPAPQAGQGFLPPNALAADAAGNLYAGEPYGILERDARGSWSLITTEVAAARAADSAGTLYAAEIGGGIRKRDLQGTWSMIATAGAALGQVDHPTALAVDVAGNLYVVDRPDRPAGSGDRIEKRDAKSNWSVIATAGAGALTALAVDRAGNLYTGEGGRIQKRDAQGSWSVVATQGSALGQVDENSGLAVDGAGSLYVADAGNNRVLKYTPSP